MKKVKALAERSGKFWAIHVPEFPNIYTQSRTLSEVPLLVKEVANLLEISIDEVEVEVADMDRYKALKKEREMLDKYKALAI